MCISMNYTYIYIYILCVIYIYIYHIYIYIIYHIIYIIYINCQLGHFSVMPVRVSAQRSSATPMLWLTRPAGQPAHRLAPKTADHLPRGHSSAPQGDSSNATGKKRTKQPWQRGLQAMNISSLQMANDEWIKIELIVDSD